MPISESARAAAGIHRKLRGLAAVFADLAATEHEKATAKELKGRLEKRLGEEAKPESAWTGIMFRRGQGVKEMTSPSSPKTDWTHHAYRLGRCSAVVSRGSDKIKRAAEVPCHICHPLRIFRLPHG
jgi:hypothetical protein